MLAFDSTLETTKLSLLRVIIEGSYEDDDYDGDKNGKTLDPFVRFILFVTEAIIYIKREGK